MHEVDTEYNKEVPITLHTETYESGHKTSNHADVQMARSHRLKFPCVNMIKQPIYSMKETKLRRCKS